MKTGIEEALFVVDRVRHLTGTTYVLRISRNGMDFMPGQHLVMGITGTGELREYSIYSGNNEDFLEVLIIEVDEGIVSRQLKSLRKGDSLEVRGPYGSFLANAHDEGAGKPLLISSGTGIAPFHSFVRSYPSSDYRIIHGVRKMEEAYDITDYRREWITVCTSRERGGDYVGRVTDYLMDADLDPDAKIFLCGNSRMIYDAMDILHARGIPPAQIFSEVYF